MRPFQFTRAGDAKVAILAHQDNASYLAGGTTLLDLMKLDVMRPSQVVDINALQKAKLGQIEFGDKGLRLGALVRMADAADHDDLQKQFPVIAQALQLAAS